MTKYTPVHRFPYPDPGSIGAGAVDIQRLAERAARRLDFLDSTWVDVLSRPTKRIRLNANQTGISANVDSFVLFDTSDFTVGDFVTSTTSIAVNQAASGWYLLQASLLTQPSGGTTQPSRKSMIRVYQFGEFDSLLERQFHREDYDAGVATGIYVAGVAYLDASRDASVYVRHTNPTSTLNVLAGSAFSAHQIIPG